ncbi:long-chain fatty acid--CoA ligase [Chitinophaga sancti]|uniref:AMP-dependent synthetase/ligase n=1 Tax=Chitinophaga sancti TaxID=1004 RepID=UPI002A756D97|nr:long-chain fatty acid--CoA ligase [Chitinophaga sancti]WPQ64574.1 long-chain fatty acid--CoA ligase [Chitinophaga sancti]
MTDQPRRLFDIIAYQLAHFPKADMLVGKENNVWKQYSTQDVADLTLRFSAGLLKLGIGNGDRTPEGVDKIAILSPNRPEWLITDLACQQAGAVLAPIYPTLSEHDLEYILNDAAASILFVSDKDLYDKVSAFRSKLPHLREVFTFNKVPGAKHWLEVPAMADEADFPKIAAIKDSIDPEQLATIIYTSGTTGTPKGVMLTHHNIMSNVHACTPCLPVNPTAKALSFLPLNHIFERTVSYIYLTAGVPIYYAESLDTIADNLREVKPSIFTTVPRLLEKVYERIMGKGLELKGIKKGLFFWAVDLGKKFDINQDQGWWYKVQLAIANKLVFSKWREALGGNIDVIVTGSAACQVRLLKIFTAAQIPILEGYGLTETSPVISVNRTEEKDRMFGTVGPLINNVEVKIAEDGEILVKGPNITIGYYKRPDLTAEAIKDGWFHTGDIGVLVNNKFLKITDRKKELFKTSGGKFVAPQPIENKFKESVFIEQMMVVGEDRKFTGALIVPSFPQLERWAHKKGIQVSDHAALCRLPEIQILFQQIVEKYNAYFSHIEQVKKFELLPQEWTIANGELSGTLKVKRKVIAQKYAEQIEKIYN